MHCNCGRPQRWGREHGSVPLDTSRQETKFAISVWKLQYEYLFVIFPSHVLCRDWRVTTKGSSESFRALKTLLTCPSTQSGRQVPTDVWDSPTYERASSFPQSNKKKQPVGSPYKNVSDRTGSNLGRDSRHPDDIVACRPVARQHLRNKLDKDRY
jgi:hypothetical protein